MAVTPIIEPQQVAPARNPMLLKLLTDNLWSVVGVKAQDGPLFSAAPIDGDTFTISFKTYSYTFTIKNAVSPGDPYTWMRKKNTGETLSDYVTNIVLPTISKAYHIHQNYDLSLTLIGSPTPNLPQVIIRAKQTGSEWTIRNTVDPVTGRIAENTDIRIDGVDGLRRENFKIYCDIYVQEVPGTGDFILAGSPEADPDEDGYASFRLDRYITFDRDDLPTQGSYVSYNAKIIKPYYYVYGEKFGTPIAHSGILGLGPQSAKIALDGGFRFDRFPSYQMGDAFYDEWVNAATNKFLTLAPRIQTICPQMPIWLYYYVHQGTSAVLKGKIFYSDGTDSTESLLSFPAVYTQITALPVGLNQLGAALAFLDIDPDDVVAYELWIEFDSSARRSESFTFLISDVQYEFNRFILFKNSLGGYDTLWCHGICEVGAEVDILSAKRNVPSLYDSSTRELLQYSKSYMESVKVSTGYKGREDLFDGQGYVRYLRDLLISEDAHEWQDGPIAITIEDQKFPSKPDNETMNSLSFTYKYAAASRSFTP